jgi:hypothetical protein
LGADVAELADALDSKFEFLLFQEHLGRYGESDKHIDVIGENAFFA